MPGLSEGAQHSLLQLQEEVKPWLFILYSNVSILSQFVALAEYFPLWFLGGTFPGAVLFVPVLFPLRAAGLWYSWVAPGGALWDLMLLFPHIWMARGTLGICFPFELLQLSPGTPRGSS